MLWGLSPPITLCQFQSGLKYDSTVCASPCLKCSLPPPFPLYPAILFLGLAISYDSFLAYSKAPCASIIINNSRQPTWHGSILIDKTEKQGCGHKLCTLISVRNHRYYITSKSLRFAVDSWKQASNSLQKVKACQVVSHLEEKCHCVLYTRVKEKPFDKLLAQSWNKNNSPICAWEPLIIDVCYNEL